jgi:hypothetical protein
MGRRTAAAARFKFFAAFSSSTGRINSNQST